MRWWLFSKLTVIILLCMWVKSWVGNNNPVQYSCLKGHMDRGTWLAIVHRDAKRDKTERLLIWVRSWSYTSLTVLYVNYTSIKLEEKVPKRKKLNKTKQHVCFDSFRGWGLSLCGLCCLLCWIHLASTDKKFIPNIETVHYEINRTNATRQRSVPGTVEVWWGKTNSVHAGKARPLLHGLILLAHLLLQLLPWQPASFRYNLIALQII